MAQQLLQFCESPATSSVSPMTELGAYEALCLRDGFTFARLALIFHDRPNARPSDLVPEQECTRCAAEAYKLLASCGISNFGIRLHGDGEYPRRLRDAASPVELLYFQGWWSLVDSPCIAVVGSRRATRDGLRIARQIAVRLVEMDYTVVSGLAEGIDTSAHEAAIQSGGRTIAVIGTSLGNTYPARNAELQRHLSEDHLVISQVPVLKYAQQDFRQNRFFFPERNKTMSALTLATVIVEAGDTSGTLVQARAALRQGRKLFIMDSCFRDASLSWPHSFVKRGAVRVGDHDDLMVAIRNEADTY